MTRLDLLSDTVYREQAIRQLEDLLGECRKFPVRKTQLYGLRKIARQEPGKVSKFASHQRNRAERKDEVAFWKLVEKLSDSNNSWSVRTEGLAHAPAELREANIPAKKKGMTPAERTHRNELIAQQKKWLDQWARDHIPAFFERFCTHALYRLEKSKAM